MANPQAHYERLSALDASFLHIEEPSAHMHVAATLLFDAAPLTLPDAGLDSERIRAFVASRLHLVPRYRQRLAWTPRTGHPVWVDDDRFNIVYHVRHTALPKPGSERQLKRLVGRILSQQLDRGKPLWEMWVIEGVVGGRFALVAKAHHCMVDGISGVDLLTALLTPDPAESPAHAPPWTPRRAPTALELLAGEVWRRAEQPLRLLGAAASALRDPLGALGTVGESIASVTESLAGGLRSTSPTPLNVPIGPHRRFDWLRLPLDDMRAVRRVFGGTLNDVVLATVAGGLGRFLEARGVLTEGLEYRAMIPVSFRSREERGTLGNKVSLLLAPLPLAERDPYRRLVRVIETTVQLKTSRQAHGAELLEELADMTAPALLTQTVRMAVALRTYNLVVTNVPGPPVPLYLLGAQMTAVYPAVPLYANQGVGIALFSYAGDLYWGFNADWETVPDLHELVRAMAASFDELRATAHATERARLAHTG
jgi:diacylglycerol O-acyltransferase / wax synthase